MSGQNKTNRRRFLLNAGAATGVLGLGSLLKYNTQLFLLRRPPVQADEPREEWSGSTVQSYRRLGRTGWKMSDISFGSSDLTDPDILRRALDRGVNYVDTSPDYSDSESEKAVGQALKGRRDKVFVASKFCTPDGHLDADTPVEKIMEAVDQSLKRLDTDYVDLLHIHACNSVDRLMAPTFHEAFDRLKEQGKARFMGVSSHTPELETVFRTAVDSDRFDVMMAAYNFQNWPKLEAIMANAHEAGVGVVAMKTLKGAFHTILSDFESVERQSFTQAAFSWVNSNPHVSGLVVTISNMAQIDEYLYASGKKAEPEQLALLQRYDELIAGRYCKPGCGDCLEACPVGVPINDVLRQSMYFKTYGAEKRAMRGYAELTAEHGINAQACATCPAPCEDKCESGVRIKEQMLIAHERLSLSA